MIERIIGLWSCLMCAFPFLIISIYNKDSKEPINFWTGDNTLKSKIKNVKAYNEAMAKLYKKFAVSFIIAGIGFFILPVIGIILLCLDLTLGIYIVYKNYKKTLNLYSFKRG